MEVFIGYVKINGILLGEKVVMLRLKKEMLV